MSYVLTKSSQITCMHGAQAQAVTVCPRVQVDKQPVILQTANYTVSGCPNIPEAGGPCATGQWIQGATRVFSQGTPLLIDISQGLCAPTGVKLVVAMAQMRVKAL
ncbi:MAG: hypothetical protein K0S11_537 [Gammaproteobacteria bacterium]|jgi:hypothetical protein|nr:hypothetical protein [Gammaproteobacteria bacterium]